MRRLVLASTLVGLAATAIAPGARADVKVGDVITSANKDQLKGAIPDDLTPWVIDNNPDLKMTIVATEDYPPAPKYVEATVKFACQPSLDAQGNLVHFTAGQPFPYSEWAKKATNHACDLKESDPQFALKLAWDVNYRWQGGSGLNLPHWGFSNMRNFGKETWRVSQGEYRRTYFSGRADLLPEQSQLEPGTDIEWAEFFDVKTPYDLRGTMFLLYRYNTTAKEDDTWAYIPALRRVRRIAATQKSDSLLGTEFTLEDFYIFSGYVWDHQWEFKGDTTVLGAMDSKRKCFPRDFESTASTAFTRLGTDEEWNACRFGPYRALAFVDETWQKRSAFELDDVPRQKGHPYSRKKIWYDKETMMPLYSLMYDRAGKPYKTINSIFVWSETSGIDGNKGKNVLNYAHILIANVQNNNSHSGQFDTANAVGFSVDESKNYYDTTRLKTLGHR
ncbi:MAG TPA: DUF1329 domain-containing protein [Myxococcota bacterium]|nr:DUF1329 domain-containing protein [Myxococcota bacterium]